ncbi:hypothetical protein SUGI_0536650 [Cryptomeria japonica]|nr:hypothetical protein SUGI_0536650 [Cryptomeria japonica]
MMSRSVSFNGSPAHSGLNETAFFVGGFHPTPPRIDGSMLLLPSMLCGGFVGAFAVTFVASVTTVAHANGTIGSIAGTCNRGTIVVEEKEICATMGAGVTITVVDC